MLILSCLVLGSELIGLREGLGSWSTFGCALGFKDGVRYLLGVFVGVGLFFGENSCVQKTLQEKKKEDFKHKHALGEGRGVEDGPATKNRGRNTNRKGSKTALSLPKNGKEREG